MNLQVNFVNLIIVSNRVVQNPKVITPPWDSSKASFSLTTIISIFLMSLYHPSKSELFNMFKDNLIINMQVNFFKPK